MRAHKLIDNFAKWARLDDRVLGAGICGSHARCEARPGSDIDFCILTSDPGSLLQDTAWISDLGSEPRIAGPVEDYNLVQSIRVFYGATEAEFGVTHEAWAQPPIDNETAGVINDGLQILYDPEGRLEAALAYSASMFR